MSMSSERSRSTRLWTVLVAPAARRAATHSLGELHGVRTVATLKRIVDEGWTAPSLLLLDLEAPTDAHRVQLSALRGRWRRTRRYVVGLPDELEARREAWGDLVDGAICLPLASATLETLGELARATSRVGSEARRSARRIEALEERLALMSDTIQAAGALLDPGMVARFIMERAAAMVGSRHWRLYRVDEVAGLLRVDARHEPGGKTRAAEQLPIDAGLAGWVARHREIVQIGDVAADPRVDREREWPGDPPASLLLIPLVSRGRVIGVAELAEPLIGPIRWREQGLLAAMLDPAAIALDNALLFRRLEERTVTDDLTHLYNARFMENYLRRETKRAQRFQRPVALLFIDLDGFKAVNDVHGHMAGSRTLVEVGEILRKNVREVDVVARWGGDEFAVVLPETGLEGAMAMAERICRRIQEGPYLEEAGLEINISASIGVAVWPENGRTAEALLASADAAMYQVKDRGKNGVLAADPADLREPVLV